MTLFAEGQATPSNALETAKLRHMVNVLEPLAVVFYSRDVRGGIYPFILRHTEEG